MAIVGRDMLYEEHLIGLQMTNTSTKKIILFAHVVLYRGYYTVARRYEFYFRVAKQYFTNERSE